MGGEKSGKAALIQLKNIINAKGCSDRFHLDCRHHHVSQTALFKLLNYIHMGVLWWSIKSFLTVWKTGWSYHLRWFKSYLEYRRVRMNLSSSPRPVEYLKGQFLDYCDSAFTCLLLVKSNVMQMTLRATWLSPCDSGSLDSLCQCLNQV